MLERERKISLIHQLREAIDNWYNRAKADAVAGIVLALMTLAIAKGAVFAGIIPFPASGAESSSFLYGWTVAHTFSIPQGIPTPPPELTETLPEAGRGAQAMLPGAEAATAEEVRPNPYNAVATVVLEVTRFLNPSLQVFFLRLLGALMLAIVVWIAFDLVRTLLPERRALQLGAAAVVALHPQLSCIASTATPLILYILGSSIVLYVLVKLIAGQIDPVGATIMIGATLIVGTPPDRALLLGVAALVIALMYFGVPQRYPAAVKTLKAAPWVLVGLFIWRSVFPELIKTALPSLQLEPMLPSFRTEISPSLLTLSTVLKGLAGITDDPAGWTDFPLSAFLASFFVSVAVLVLVGLGVMLARRLRAEAAQMGVDVVPRGEGAVALTFLVLLGTTYIGQLPTLLDLTGVGSEAVKGTLSEVPLKLLPYVQGIAFIGLVLTVFRIGMARAELLRRTLRAGTRAASYGLWVIALFTAYAVVIQPPITPSLPSFPLVAIAGTSLILVAGLLALWPARASELGLVRTIFWTLFVVDISYVLGRLLPTPGQIFGVTSAPNLMSTILILLGTVTVFVLTKRVTDGIRTLEKAAEFVARPQALPSARPETPAAAPRTPSADESTPSKTQSDSDLRFTWESSPTREPER